MELQLYPIVREIHHEEIQDTMLFVLLQIHLHFQIENCPVYFLITGLIPSVAIFFLKASCDKRPPTALTHPESAHKSPTRKEFMDVCKTQWLKL